jgi:hypothetical protein
VLSCWQGVGDCIPLSQDDGEWIGCLPNKIAICATVASGNNTDYCSALLLNRDSKSGIQQGLTIGIIVGGGQATSASSLSLLESLIIRKLLLSKT